MTTVDTVQTMIESILKDVTTAPNSPASKRLLKVLECGTVAELKIKLQDADSVLNAAKLNAASNNSSRHKELVIGLIDYIHLRDFTKQSNRAIRHKLALLAMIASLVCFVTGAREEQTLMFGLSTGACLPELIERWKKIDFS